MNNSFQKRKNKLAQNIMKAKSPSDFNIIMKNIKKLSVSSNHELCSIKTQAHQGQQRSLQKQKIEFYKKRLLNRSEQAKQKADKKYNNFHKRVIALRGNFNTRVKNLKFNQNLHNEALIRKKYRKQNYRKAENRTLALHHLMK